MNVPVHFFSLPVCSPPSSLPERSFFPRLSDSPSLSLPDRDAPLSLSLSHGKKRETGWLTERVGCRVLDSTCIFSSDQRIIAVERQPDGVCRLIARQRCVSLRVTCRERRANRSARLRSAPLCSALCRTNERAGTACIYIYNTGNALTHFNPSYTDVSSRSSSLFSSPLPLPLLFLSVSSSILPLHPSPPPLFVSPLHRTAALSTPRPPPPRVPPSGHPFARLIHRISLAEDRGRVRCPRHVVLMHVIAANLIKPAD